MGLWFEVPRKGKEYSIKTGEERGLHVPKPFPLKDVVSFLDEGCYHVNINGERMDNIVGKRTWMQFPQMLRSRAYLESLKESAPKKVDVSK